MDFFKHVLEGLERVLYEVDEWLRFKSGETELTLRIKAVLGLPWAIVRFVVGFLVTVLVEPQINPIKHFPVVTVSHKVILPMQPMLASPLGPVFGNVLANTIAGVTVLLLPGVVGFLVWELRGNWRLYAVNRHRELRPVIVGSHGETLVRLMKLGLHSGTIPRLFARLRRRGPAGDRHASHPRLDGLLREAAPSGTRCPAVLRAGVFGVSRRIDGVSRGPVRGGPDRSSARTACASRSAPRSSATEPLWIGFVEQSGRVVAGVWRAGWTRNLTVPQRSVLAGLLTGFYRVGGVELVREQIEACLGKEARPYDVTERGLTLRPGSARREEVIYDLDEVPQIVPRVEGILSTTTYPTVDAESLVFGRTRTLWNDWIAAWSHDDAGEPFPVSASAEGPSRLFCSAPCRRSH